MITLKDLNNIDVDDLKNIDWNQVADKIRNRPHYIVNSLLWITSLIVILWSLSGFLGVSRTSKKDALELNERVTAVEELDAAKKGYNDFLKNAPEPITGDQLIQTLSELALRRNIQIRSFSPAEEKDNDMIGLTSVKVNISSKSYAEIILFVNDIEELSYPVRVTNWSGSAMQPVDEGARRRYRRPSYTQTEPVKKPEEDMIKATITIESVEFKNA